jgi:hypothetical protein
MIAAIGLDVDPTFAVFVAAARKRGVPLIALNLRAAVEGEWQIPLPPVSRPGFGMQTRPLSSIPNTAISAGSSISPQSRVTARPSTLERTHWRVARMA